MVLLVAGLAVSLSPARGDDWPQWLGPQRDGVWRETGLLDKFPKDGPKVLWRVPIDGGYAGPAVAEGRVYVTDYVTDGDRKPDPAKRNKLTGKERVLCLNVADGKLIWKHEYDCPYEIRSTPWARRAISFASTRSRAPCCGRRTSRRTTARRRTCGAGRVTP
jgi:hypothetical protein